MKQRTSHKLVVTIDIIQDLPDESTQQEVINDCDNIKLTLERVVVQALTDDHGHNAKVIVTKLPEFV